MNIEKNPFVRIFLSYLEAEFGGLLVTQSGVGGRVTDLSLNG